MFFCGVLGLCRPGCYFGQKVRVINEGSPSLYVCGMHGMAIDSYSVLLRFLVALSRGRPEK
jgi:hypothetical protein